MSECVFISQDNYLTVTPGEPIRLFPIGRLVKGGKVRELTRELLSKFKLPPFFPPIKLGSHKDEAPAGGHIVALEMRDDGLYGIPEYTEEGQAAVARGDFRYHSPEVVWEGGFENSETGEVIEGPLLIGAALLHMPHLGDRAKLYSFEEVEHGGETTMELTFDQLKELFTSQRPEPKQPVIEPVKPSEPKEPEIDVAKYEADLADARQQAEALQAQLDAIKAGEERTAKVEQFGAVLGDHVPDAVKEALADMDDEQAKVITDAFSALIEQANHANLENDLGNSGQDGNGTGVERYNAAVEKYMADNPGVTRDRAAIVVLREHPDILED